MNATFSKSKARAAGRTELKFSCWAMLVSDDDDFAGDHVVSVQAWDAHGREVTSRVLPLTAKIIMQRPVSALIAFHQFSAGLVLPLSVADGDHRLTLSLDGKEVAWCGMRIVS